MSYNIVVETVVCVFVWESVYFTFSLVEAKLSRKLTSYCTLQVIHNLFDSRGSSVRIVSDYGMDDRAI
jgi:hypothetical protein